jgi:hypothetical protein
VAREGRCLSSGLYSLYDKGVENVYMRMKIYAIEVFLHEIYDATQFKIWVL